MTASYGQRLILLAAVALAACGGGPASDETAPEGPANRSPNALHRGSGGDPQTLDPHRAEDEHAFAVLRDLYEGLVTTTPDGGLAPGAAERWTVGPDGETYRFHLRADARWSNGEPVTAGDFVAGLRRALSPALGSPYASLLYPIRNAEAVASGDLAPEALGAAAPDPRTLILELAAPTPHLPALLAHPVSVPLPPAAGAPDDAQTALVTNGAYTLVEWRPLTHIALRRNPHYRDREAVAIERVFYYPIVDPDVEFDRYRTGGLHLTWSVPAVRFARIRERYGDELRVAPTLALYYYAFDLTAPPFDDLRVRRALSMAVDRRLLVENVIGRGELPAYSLVPPGVAGYETQRYPWAGLAEEARLARARSLLREAGYADDGPLRFDLTYDTGGIHERIALAVAGMWREGLGVDARLVAKEWKLFLAGRDERESWEMMRFGWHGDYNDASTFTDILRADSPQNLPGYDNPEYDRLLESAAAEGDAAARARLLAAAEALMLADYPLIPLYFPVSKRLVSPRVIGYADNVLDRHPSRHLRLAPAGD